MKYKTRYFNKLEYIDGIHALKKISPDVEKIKAEYDYYYKLPNHLQRYFVQPFHFEIHNEMASYHLEKYSIDDVAKQFVQGMLSLDSFIQLLEKIKRFQWECPSNELSKDDIYKEAKSIVIDKSIDRCFLLESNTLWKKSTYREKIKKNGITTDILFKRLERAFHDNILNRQTNIVRVSHGDLCFSNILWEKDLNIIRFIDPKGLPHFVIDEYYDIAKLSHSILGRYDDIIYEMYDLDFESNKLNFTASAQKDLEEAFLQYLKEKNIDYKLLRVFEASMFLSMCKTHIEDEKRVAAFLMNCSKILDELGY